MIYFQLDKVNPGISFSMIGSDTLKMFQRFLLDKFGEEYLDNCYAIQDIHRQGIVMSWGNCEYMSVSFNFKLLKMSFQEVIDMLSIFDEVTIVEVDIGNRIRYSKYVEDNYDIH